MFEHFKDKKGQFACSDIQTEGEIRSILNLFRASLIAFPGERAMEDAEFFSTIYLKEALQKIPVCSLSREVRGNMVGNLCNICCNLCFIAYVL